MRFICENCVSPEYSVIPAFILKSWSFKKFSISKHASDLLNRWIEKPIIHIKTNGSLIKRSSMLKQTIILKRQIHKIFDLMKCEDKDNFVIRTLGENKYLILRELLFSLKDLVEINDYSMISKLQSILNLFEAHITKECNVNLNLISGLPL